MYKILISKKISAANHLRIFKSLFIFTNATSMLLYIFLRMLFYNTPITLNDDVIAFLKTLMIGSLIAICLHAVLVIIELADYLFTQRTIRLAVALRYAVITLFSMALFYFSARKTRMPASGDTGYQLRQNRSATGV